MVSFATRAKLSPRVASKKKPVSARPASATPAKPVALRKVRAVPANEPSLAYARRLSTMIQADTVSYADGRGLERFVAFRQLMREMFPHIFAACEYEDLGEAIIMRWPGSNPSLEPVLLMHHHDVVEVTPSWHHDPFAGEISQGRVWGRGTLDDKGSLFTLFQAADELAQAGYVPEHDIYFESSCTEETSGTGCRAAAQELHRRGLHFCLCLDEGGAITYEPIGGVKGTFAMVGVGEKAQGVLRFTAKSAGGHASTPTKGTPLVRLGKFMAAAESRNGRLFPARVPDALVETLCRMAPASKGALGFVFKRAEGFRPVLQRVLPTISGTTNALTRTTLAFTMASGSEGDNVLPTEAWVMADIRIAHHQGAKDSIEAITALARKFDIETEVVTEPYETGLTNHEGWAFKTVETAISATFPNAAAAPFITNTASDSRFMRLVCDDVINFMPFTVSAEQMASIHADDENVDVDALAPAVSFYKTLMKDL